jgi:hypothetical protein
MNNPKFNIIRLTVARTLNAALNYRIETDGVKFYLYDSYGYSGRFGSLNAALARYNSGSETNYCHASNPDGI